MEHRLQFERPNPSDRSRVDDSTKFADILRDHVKPSVEGIDRLYLNVYVPWLQTEQGIAWFFRHRWAARPLRDAYGPVEPQLRRGVDGFAVRRESLSRNFVRDSARTI
jgi:hypothetical protein